MDRSLTMGRGKKNAYASKAASNRLDFERRALYTKDNFDDDEAQYEKDNKRNKSDIIKENVNEIVIQTKSLKGKPSKPYLGKRILQAHNGKKGRRSECENLIDTVTEGHYGYDLSELYTYNGKAAIAMVFEMFGKHNAKFYDQRTWNVIMTHFIATYIAPGVLKNSSLKRIRSRIYQLRSNIGPLLNIYGPAFIPKAYVIVDGVKRFYHKIPLKALRKAQKSFDDKRNIERLFGPQFSSDNSGDGPEPPNYNDQWGVLFVLELQGEYTPCSRYHVDANLLDFDIEEICVLNVNQRRLAKLLIDNLEYETVYSALNLMFLNDANAVHDFIDYIGQLGTHLDFRKINETTWACYGLYPTITRTRNDLHEIFSTLNGNNGEWTNSDDVEELELLNNGQFCYELYCYNHKDKFLKIYDQTLLEHEMSLEYYNSIRPELEKVFKKSCKSKRFPGKIGIVFSLIESFKLQELKLAELLSFKVLYTQKQERDLMDCFKNNRKNIKFLTELYDRLITLTPLRCLGTGPKQNKGNKMINNKVINQGSGSTSKVPQPPSSSLSKEAVKQLNDKMAAKEEEIKDDEKKESILAKKQEAKITINENPKSKTVFNRDEIRDQKITHNIQSFDANGAPYCGYVHQCVARNIEFDQTYVTTLMSDIGTKDPYMVGGFDCLSVYAQVLGHNLVIITKSIDYKEIVDSKFSDISFGDYKIVGIREHDKNYDWVVLIFEQHGTFKDEAGYMNSHGHYTLGVYNGKNSNRFELPNLHSKDEPFLFYRVKQTLKQIEILANDKPTQCDLRSPNMVREKFILEDREIVVMYTRTVEINWRIVFALAHLLLVIVSPFTSFFTQFQLQCFLAIFGIIDIPNEFVVYETKFKVSSLLASSNYPSVQITPFTDLKAAAMLTKKDFNVDVNSDNVYNNTKFYLKTASDIIHSTDKPVEYKLITQFNEPNDRTKIPIKVSNNIVAAYEMVKALNIRGTGLPMDYPNFIMEIKENKSPLKSGIPIATAPIGPIYNNGLILSPGMLPVTDQPGIIVAFGNRSMGKLAPEFCGELLEFEQFFKDFYTPMLDACDFSQLDYENPIDYFRKHYKGKRSSLWVEGVIDSYNHYLMCESNSHYDSNGCFVKLENSAKKYGTEYAPKPRLIMVMSPVLLMEFCQFLKCIEVWNEGPIKQYQIKHEELPEITRKVCEVSDRPHNVTDYSSFECSDVFIVRACEGWIMKEMLRRSGFDQLIKTYNERMEDGRILKSCGVKMFINSRNSGDFQTSFGNGVINIALAHFCAMKKGIKEIKMVAEGDDALVESGVMDPDLLNKVGFEFSDSIFGSYEGDTDFLQKRWMDGKIYLNIPKKLSTLWVRNKAHLNIHKQLFLLRCMGSSLHHLSPGHPILCALVNRIGRLTASYRTPFKNWHLHLDLWEHRYIDVDNYPRHVEADESMRANVAQGAIGFDPIPIPLQVELENLLNSSKQIIDLEGVLDYTPEIKMYQAAGRFEPEYSDCPDTSYSNLVAFIKATIAEPAARRAPVRR